MSDKRKYFLGPGKFLQLIYVDRVNRQSGIITYSTIKIPYGYWYTNVSGYPPKIIRKMTRLERVLYR